jgi:CRP-like cAMP-binding protein
MELFIKREEESCSSGKFNLPVFKQFVSFFLLKKVKKKEFLLKAGEVNENLFFVKKGLLRVYLEYEGREINTWFVREDEFILSVDSFHLNTPSREYIQALEDCEILSIKKSTYEMLIKGNHNAALTTINELYTKLCEFQHQCVSLRFMSAEKKYEYLVKDKREIINRLSQKHIASFLGIETTYLSKIISGHKNEDI